MYEGAPRRRAGTEYRRRRTESAVIRHPDRIALWAVVMAVVGMIAAAASAHASGGGTRRRTVASARPVVALTSRSAPARSASGDCGGDVKTLHWLLKASSYGVPLDKKFDHPTDDSVRRFQRRHHIHADGVVGRRTRKKIVHTMHKKRRDLVRPQRSQRRHAGEVAPLNDWRRASHPSVWDQGDLKYRGHFVRAKVIDRGPYAHRRPLGPHEADRRQAPLHERGQGHRSAPPHQEVARRSARCGWSSVPADSRRFSPTARVRAGSGPDPRIVRRPGRQATAADGRTLGSDWSCGSAAALAIRL